MCFMNLGIGRSLPAQRHALQQKCGNLDVAMLSRGSGAAAPCSCREVFSADVRTTEPPDPAICEDSGRKFQS
jgi:hypothetical protein